MVRKKPSSKKKHYYQTMIGDDQSGNRSGKYSGIKYNSHRKRGGKK